MKKLALLAIGIVSLAGTAIAATDVQFNQEAEKTLAQLEKKGYTNIRVTGQEEGYCTIAKSDFDFNASTFVAKKNGKTVTGAVCNNKVYFKDQA